MRPSRRATAAALVLAALPAPASAWGEFGHRLIARIADAELTPRARARIGQILARGSAVGTPTCPLKRLDDAAVWPDCVRGLGDRFAFAAPWHYQNISTCRAFDITANCPDGNCVTAQIPRQLKIAASRSASPAARAQALAFVVHFVGDLHQPLHVGDRGDRGGNDVAAHYGAKDPPRMNLHRVWDTELAERALTEPPAITPLSPTAAQRRLWAQGDVTSWARESWELAKTLVYARLPAFPDTCRGATTTVAQIDARYIAAATPPLRMRVEQAGVRLAVLLNRAFDG